MDHIIGQIESIEQIEIKPTEPIEPGLRLFFFYMSNLVCFGNFFWRVLKIP